MLSRLARRLVELEPMPQPPLLRARHPVMLMHGFGAMANLVQCGVLHDEAMHLRGRGVLAYAPHVNPYDTIAVRAEAWAERLDRVLAETGAARVHCIAFSSAGLDARHMATALGLADRIASVVTVACPHRGTPLAAYVLERPDRMRRWAVGLMDFMGTAAYEASPPRAEAALRELTPAAVAERFDAARTLPAPIYCASVSSRAGKGAPASVQYPPLLVPNRLLHRLAGENDGIVPTASMAWGEHLGTVEADHAALVGMRLPGGGFDSNAFYRGLVEHLVEVERAGVPRETSAA